MEPLRAVSMQNSLAAAPQAAATTPWRDRRICSAPPPFRLPRTARSRGQRRQRQDFPVASMQQQPPPRQSTENRETLSAAAASWHWQVRSATSPESRTPLALASILLPVAAACAVFLGSPSPAEAGIFSGLESFQLPSLPTPDTLKKIQEANVEKYKAFDSNFKSSPYLQGLLKKSKENKEMHRKEIEDKYCERGAEWGIGDCSLVGLPQADKDAFFEKLKEGKQGK